MRASGLSVVLAGVYLALLPVSAEESPLHTLIDSRLSAAHIEDGVCGDTEFLRRVSLDLTGMPPGAARTRSFVNDESPQKRTQIVDDLIQSPQFDRHIATTLDVMLMERRANTHVPQDDWYRWLHAAVRDNRPWNDIAREILTADGDDPATRPAARFFLDRQSEQHLLTRDIGRIFFGRDLQCAQCHDHPLIDDYHQADYHGLLAFLAPGYPVVRKVTTKEGDRETTVDVTVHAEKSGSDLTFSSVFIEESRHRTGPRLPDDVAIVEPFQYPGEEYEIAPAEGVKSVPRFSRRARLAELATSGSNRMFNENIANRLWAHMLGRGLVHPVDLHHPDNPPAHPELLKLLGEHFAAMDFDVRSFLREIALSRVYQRPFDRPQDPSAASPAIADQLPNFEAEREQLAGPAEASASEYAAALEAWEQAEADFLPAADALDGARKGYSDARSQLDSATSALAASQSSLETKQAAHVSIQQAVLAVHTALDQLGDDGELTVTAETLTRRAEELLAETTALSATVEEQTTALAAAQATCDQSKQSLDEAAAAVVPFGQKLQQTEQIMLSARRAMQNSAAAAASTELRLKTVSSIASLSQLRQTLTVAQQAVIDRNGILDLAREALQKSTVVLEERQAELVSAEEAMSIATASLVEAKEVLAQRVRSVGAVESAATAARSASESFPDDVILAEAAQTLADRSIGLRTAMAEFETAVKNAEQVVNTAAQARNSVQEKADLAAEEQTLCRSAVDAALASVEEARVMVVDHEAAQTAALAELTEDWSSDFTLASLKPLTPEQLCWSLLKVTGIYDREWKTAERELEQSAPSTDEQKQDAVYLATRAKEIEHRTYDKLKSSVAPFVQFYAAAAGQPQSDFFATADQALFSANGGTINSWITPADDNVTNQLVTATDTDTAAEVLYLGILNRFPTPEESADVGQWFTVTDADRNMVVRDLVWGLLNSIEFRFNH